MPFNTVGMLEGIRVANDLRTNPLMFQQMILIGIGGALGAMSRFGIAQLSEHIFKHEFPLGTLIANVLGCFLIGVLIGSGHHEKSETLKMGFGIGFLGALTTFSTFGAETMHHATHDGQTLAIVNVALNLGLGLVAVTMGMWAGKRISG